MKRGNQEQPGKSRKEKAKMKRLLGLSCLVLVLSMSGVAYAGQKTGLYLGGSIGESSLDIAAGAINFTDHDYGYKVFAGYNFGVIPLIDLGVEGSYVNFGKASSAQILNQNIGVTAWDLFGVAAVNLGPSGLFGKVGQAWWHSDTGIPLAVLDNSGSDMVYGIGLRFQLGSIALRVEYERFNLNVADINYGSAGASWTF
jgi:outer membrane immunogenic protein